MTRTNIDTMINDSRKSPNVNPIDLNSFGVNNLFVGCAFSPTHNNDMRNGINHILNHKLYLVFKFIFITCPKKSLKRLLGMKILKHQSQKPLRFLRLAPSFHFLSDLISRFFSPAGLVRRRNPAAFTQALPSKLSGNTDGFGDAKSLSVAPISKFLLFVKEKGEVRKPTVNWSKALASTSPNLSSLLFFGFILFPFDKKIAHFN